MGEFREAFDINGFNEDARFPTNIPEFKTNVMDLAKRTIELSERCSEHSYYGTFTLLFQDQYPGLRVKSPSGQWISAKPIPGTILVNIGDLLEMWTGGLFPATRHRVIIPEEEVLKSVPRQSIVFFVHPDNEVVVEPVDSDAKNYSAVVALDYVERRFSETYQF